MARLFLGWQIAFSILMYVILDGYDLGVGILFGTMTDERHRVRMMGAITPFWEGNETRLVLIDAGLFAAFPMVYAILLPAFYLPVWLMLFGIAFRRFRVPRSKHPDAAGLGPGLLILGSLTNFQPGTYRFTVEPSAPR